MFFIALQLLCWLSVTQASPTVKLDKPTVTISNGVIIGTATTLPTPSSKHEIVHLYLGIPFAKPPIGTLRFAPPQSASNWSNPLNATSYSPSCMQQFPGANGEVIQSNVKKIFGTYGEKAPEESEDCLYLNIYAPPPTANKRPKPVMFWIFGGNLQFGSASLERYNGGCLAARNDVIVVTINYRLNIFGFANSPELSRGTQNAGFLDQRRALLWVQENIAAFGGDPAKVLLFGESAGAYSVKQLLANPTPHEPLPFAAAIMQSQQSGHGAKSDLAWDRVVLHFGCQDRMSHLGCLREVPAQALKDFIETHYVTFGPVQEDGTSTMDVRKSINSGTFAKVPMLIGTNANEARAFEAFIGMEKGSALLDFVQKWFRVPNTSHLTQHFESVLQTPAMDRYRAVDEILTDMAFTCPSGQLASYLASKGYNVWRYHFSGVYPNMAIFGTHPEQGAYHTAEIPMVFGTSGSGSTPAQIELSQLMQGIWSRMAEAPEQGPGWPRVNESVLAEMGSADGRKLIQTIPFASIDRKCAHLGALAQKAGLAW